ncbi:zinc/manganese transport system ATP-binding protein [Microbacterium sp. ru370.1]|uniref:zinc ABC transporter ATP-binding protein AztA n=1 Tax=unclassified Microbacterium TaxID=2609290 RepID=UPI000891402E|nr:MULTISPECIES: zinc ABC transporter ATP-binding protein AztA [unclassified Microbacterium]SDO94102.1 zinc/manganese transport system ATP-binding protein [Microbacterium sp. ru370.1]SIT93191.1 zinc/manganese transport system ATP-binding protein [Microbacterium sp. RU1D]
MPLPFPNVTALSARALRVTFGGTTALDEVDLDVPRSALTVIVGPNGAGKSTLLEALAGAREPSAGRVDAHGLARSFVPQRAAISEHLPLTVRDVVSVGAWGRAGAFRPLRAADRAAVDEALQRLDIATLARRPFGVLSGGQRQRALLAQGLARRADVLLLDEPTTGLDAASAHLNRAAIADEIGRGATVVCVSHDQRLIAAADHIVELTDGRVTRNEVESVSSERERAR